MARHPFAHFIRIAAGRAPSSGVPAWFAFLLCLLLAAGAARGAEIEQDIGQAIGVVPGAFVVRDGENLPLALHSPLRVSDVVGTDATGRVRILFNDDSTVSIGGNTRLDLRDFADSGAKPVFNVHLMQGAARVVTGRVVEMNPAGFAVTTPEAHVGIRGTIVSLRSANGVTTVYVENTTREVYVNDVNVPGGQKITLPDDPPRIEPILPEDRRELGRDFAFLGGAGAAAAAPEPGMVERRPSETPLAFVSADEGSAPPDTPLKTLPLTGDLLASAPWLLPSGYVAGMLSSGGFGTSSYADFAFTVDLGSGAISGAEMHGLALVGTTQEQFDVVGGAGTLSGGTASIGGFTGYAISAPTGFPANVFTIVPADPTSMSITATNPGVLGSPVTGTYFVDATSSSWSGVDSGILNGTWQVAPSPPMIGLVSGTLTTMVSPCSPTCTFSGSFTFDVNLSSGAISNATLSGSGLAEPFPPQTPSNSTLVVNLVGGSGTITPGMFPVATIGGFSSGGANTYDSSSIVIAADSHLDVLNDPIITHNGGMVVVKYDIYNGTVSYDSGTGIGTMTK
jgi:hypothetical protein